MGDASRVGICQLIRKFPLSSVGDTFRVGTCQQKHILKSKQFFPPCPRETRRPKSWMDDPFFCCVADAPRVGVNDRAIPPHRRVFVRARAGELLLVEVLEEVFGAGVVISKL